jgi:drug/metabolite transporter (DMT)-like permease
MALLLPLALPSLLRDAKPGARYFLRSALTGALLLLAVSFLIFGFHRGASVTGSLLFLSMVPIFSLVGRKLLWGEKLLRRHQAGILLSLLGASLWFALGHGTSLSAGRFLPAVSEPGFLGHALAFLGSALLGFALAAGRPSELRVSLTTWWFHSVGFAFVFALPLMYGGHVFVHGVHAPFAGLTAAGLAASPEVLVPYVAFGLSQFFFRLQLLGKSSAQLSIGAVSLVWVGTLLLMGSALAGLLGEFVSPAHAATLPLHLLGLCLGRDALVPWSPYSGPREARGAPSKEKAA